MSISIKTSENTWKQVYIYTMEFGSSLISKTYDQ